MCLFWAEPRIGAIFPAVMIVEADAEGDLPSAKAPGRLHQSALLTCTGCIAWARNKLSLFSVIKIWSLLLQLNPDLMPNMRCCQNKNL